MKETFCVLKVFEVLKLGVSRILYFYLIAINIFTDSVAKGNPRKGGYGTILHFGKIEKELSQGFRLTTNN